VVADIVLFIFAKKEENEKHQEEATTKATIKDLHLFLQHVFIARDNISKVVAYVVDVEETSSFL
jgi:hypothetical protein